MKLYICPTKRQIWPSQHYKKIYRGKRWRAKDLFNQNSIHKHAANEVGKPNESQIISVVCLSIIRACYLLFGKSHTLSTEWNKPLQHITICLLPPPKGHDQHTPAAPTYPSSIHKSQQVEYQAPLKSPEQTVPSPSRGWENWPSQSDGEGESDPTLHQLRTGKGAEGNSPLLALSLHFGREDDSSSFFRWLEDTSSKGEFSPI